jgi:hypothetical protein
MRKLKLRRMQEIPFQRQALRFGIHRVP